MNGSIISFVGNLTRDPGELKYSRNGGNAYLTIGVAVNTWVSENEPVMTDYYNATLFGRHAENVLNRCRKGDQVFVQGNYRMRRYNRQDGTQGLSQDVSVREFHHFPRSRGAQQEGQREGQQEGQEAIPAGNAQAGAAAAIQAPAEQAPSDETSAGTAVETHGNEEPIEFGEPVNMEEVEAGDPFGEEVTA